ncbi:hypothetical protein ACFVUN_28225 [Kitasatospora griseola]
MRNGDCAHFSTTVDLALDLVVTSDLVGRHVKAAMSSASCAVSV